MFVRSITDLKTELVDKIDRKERVCFRCHSKGFAKNKVTNPYLTVPETRYYCNMCWLKVSHKIEKVNDMLYDPFFYKPPEEKGGKD